ncbi:hypothetical protein [Nocardioides sp. TF02-7]|uniref:hypothetical protein n=1 Tax=Nocardioides sp. TF02-7 TaxID=2917724 RepID=UPI001F055428|nr:hypothetical protein [Nocardioides sp. TF02-7]UMG91386.1 hypothetical protein MF408_14660 [Nocardioides sp. TF02-7]
MLRENLAKYSDDYQENLTVDLARVDFLPSLGIGVLAVAMRDAETNGAVIDLVVEPGTLAHQVLNVCGLPYRER